MTSNTQARGAENVRGGGGGRGRRKVSSQEEGEQQIIFVHNLIRFRY